MANTVGATLVVARNQRHTLSNVGATLVVARNFSLFTFHFHVGATLVVARNKTM